MDSKTSTCFEYFQSFLSLVDSVFDCKGKSLTTISDQDEEQAIKLLSNATFRGKFIANIGKDTQGVKFIAPYLVKGLAKPQHLLQDHKDYYIAIDMATRTSYICYRQLLMIDIDFYKTDVETIDLADNGNSTKNGSLNRLEIYQKTIKKLKKKCKNIGFKGRLKIYGTRNGIHAFLISKKMNPILDETIKLQLQLGSDFYYVVYSYLRGWSVRLNRKRGESKLYSTKGNMIGDSIYCHLGEIGEEKADPELVKLVQIHVGKSKEWSSIQLISLMRGG